MLELHRQQIAKSSRRDEIKRSRRDSLPSDFKKETSSFKSLPTMHRVPLLQVVDAKVAATLATTQPPALGPCDVRVLALAAEANPWRDDCDHSLCPPLANHGLHERVNSSASAAAEPSRTDGRVNSPPVEHSRPRAKAGVGEGRKRGDGRLGKSRRRGRATERRPATRPCLPRRGTGVWRGRRSACRARAGARPFPAAARAARCCCSSHFLPRHAPRIIDVFVWSAVCLHLYRVCARTCLLF
jgi:hypothetical protein